MPRFTILITGPWGACLLYATDTLEVRGRVGEKLVAFRESGDRGDFVIDPTPEAIESASNEYGDDFDAVIADDEAESFSLVEDLL